MNKKKANINEEFTIACQKFSFSVIGIMYRIKNHCTLELIYLLVTK